MPRPKDRVTIADVAQKADVSMMTVSRVINNHASISEKTRQNVLRVMGEIGYRPNRIARSLASDKTFKIGIVIPGVSSAFYAEVLEGVEHLLWEHNYHILLCNTGRNCEREQDLLRMLEEDCADGVIVFSSFLPADRLAEMLEQQRAAVVFSTDLQPPIAGVVNIDERASMLKAVKHLIKSGRRKLAYIGTRGYNRAGRERHASFMAALAETGLTIDPAAVVVCDDAPWEEGFDTSQRLLEAVPDVDAIICYNDYVAAGTLRGCQVMGRRVPDDVAIIGYDDILIARLTSPPLTTLRYTISNRRVGEMAAEMLLGRIQGNTEQDEVILQHELLIRESAP